MTLRERDISEYPPRNLTRLLLAFSERDIAGGGGGSRTSTLLHSVHT